MKTVTLTHDELRDLVRDAYLDGWDEGGEDSANSIRPIVGGGGAYGPSDPETHWIGNGPIQRRISALIARGCPELVAGSGTPVKEVVLDRFTRATREMS